MTPSMPHNSRGGFLFVLVEGDPPIHELDLTAAQRARVGLPPLTPSLAPPPLANAPTEEVGPDV